MIREIQQRWNELSKKEVKIIGNEFSLNLTTARRYLNMTEEQIDSLDFPTDYKKGKTVIDDYINILYKMLRDKIDPVIIKEYIIKKGYTGNVGTLERYIELVVINNFKPYFRTGWQYDFSYPDDLIIIKRHALFKYIITKNPKKQKDDTIERNFELIKDRYVIINILKELYDEFYEILMGKNPDRLDDFINKYKESEVKGFVDGIVNDIMPVRNAISYKESNGFVEGNNNKFKLIKRTLYGRANLDNLFRKCYMAFQPKKSGFKLSKFVKKDASL